MQSLILHVAMAAKERSETARAPAPFTYAGGLTCRSRGLVGDKLSDQDLRRVCVLFVLSPVRQAQGRLLIVRQPANYLEPTKWQPKTYQDATKCYHGLVASQNCVWPHFQRPDQTASRKPTDQNAKTYQMLPSVLRHAR